jgi:hypothetical protein
VLGVWECPGWGVRAGGLGRRSGSATPRPQHSFLPRPFTSCVCTQCQTLQLQGLGLPGVKYPGRPAPSVGSSARHMRRRVGEGAAP